MPDNEQPTEMWSGRFRELLNRTFEQWQHSFRHVALACALCFTVGAHAQDATVTFYSRGSFATSGLPGSKHGVFYGGIYDHDERLVVFHEGLIIKNNRFLTLRLPAGPHEFVASNAKRPGNEVSIPITLEPGKQYFFRAQNESSGIILVEFEKARLDQVSCGDAHKDAGDAKPLNPKHPPKTLAAMRVNTETMPSCQ